MEIIKSSIVRFYKKLIISVKISKNLREPLLSKTMRFFSFFFLFFPFSLPAQVLLDSMQSINPEQYYEQNIEEAVGKKDFAAVAKSYEQLGQILYEDRKKEEAFKAYTKSIHYYGILDDSLNYYRINVELADYYLDSKLFEDALAVQEQALSYFQREENKRMEMLLYKKIADTYRIQNFREKERYFLERSLQANKEVQDTLFEIQTQLQKSRLLEDVGLFDKARRYAARAADLSKKKQDTCFLSQAYIRLGIIYDQLEKEVLAKSLLEKGDTLFKQKPYPFPDPSDYKKISDAFLSVHDSPKAYHYLNIYVAQLDSANNDIQQNAVNKVIAKYQQEQKERELKDLQEARIDAQLQTRQQTTIIYSFLAGLLVILTGLYFIIRFYQQQISAKEIIVQQKEEINRQRIVDLENNLKIETMQSMLAGQEAERERVAKDLHDSLGGLLSTVKLQFASVENKVKTLTKVREYTKAHLMLDEACQEVRNISNNMQPGALLKLGLIPALKDLMNRFQGDHYPDIDFQHYNVDERLENTTALMIYRIVQELLNNSIKYAQANEILVQLNLNGNELVVMVEDDGVGYDIETAKKGMGTENINSRVNYLKGDISIHSMIGKGTSTLISVPL